MKRAEKGRGVLPMDDRQVPTSDAPDEAATQQGGAAPAVAARPVHYQQPLYQPEKSVPIQPNYGMPNSQSAPARNAPPSFNPAAYAPPQMPYPPANQPVYPPRAAGYPMQNVFPPYPYPMTYVPQYRPPASGKATASLVLGIISLVFAWLSFLSVVAVACAVVGLILGTIARRELPPGHSSGAATAGFVCSIIGLVFAILVLAVSIIALTALVNFGANLGPAYGV
jgi:hypothetical protein